MGAYEDELDKDLTTNIVISINGVFYAIREPDSGLSITDEFLQVKTPRINGVNVDIRKGNTPIGTFSFKLMEFEGDKTSSKIMLDDTQFLGKECIVYSGFNTGSFDFSDYKEIAKTSVTSVTKIANGYSIRTKEIVHLIAKPALNRGEILDTFLLPASTTLSITTTAGWPSSGIVRIDNEFINYSGKDIDGVTLTGLTRGISLGGSPSTAAEHDVGEKVYQVTSLDGVNPVDMLLQILLSDIGDGANNATYDVLENGLNIPPSNIDIAAIEAIRDTHFTGEIHSLFIWGNDDILKYLEKFLLPSTNLRFITINGKISLSLLDQVNFNESVPVINEDSIIGTPTWGLTSDKVVNVITVKYNFNFSNQKYESEKTLEDADSIATFGRKKTLEINMPSIRDAQNGLALAIEKGNRLLARLSTARGKVQLKCHFDKSNIAVGSNTQIVHRYIPQQGGTLGFSDQLEVMSRSIDLGKSQVTYKLEFTSYTGIRIPFIGPSPKVTVVADQKTFELDNAACLNVGDRVVLLKDGDLDIDSNPTAGSYLPDTFRTIDSIVGNIVIVDTDFTSILEVGLWVKLPDYDEATSDQKAKYAFVGENTGFFNDGSKSYQVIF